MNPSTQHDIGSYIVTTPETAGDGETITAAAGNDNVAVAGTAVDRKLTNRTLLLSCKLVQPYKATLAATKTLSIALKLQHSTSGGSAFTTAATVAATRARHIAGGATGAGTVTELTLNSSGELAATVVATGGGGGTVELGVVEMDIDLAVANQYIRSNRTADLNATGTDTVVLGPPQIIFGGGPVMPAV